MIFFVWEGGRGNIVRKHRERERKTGAKHKCRKPPTAGIQINTKKNFTQKYPQGTIFKQLRIKSNPVPQFNPCQSATSKINIASRGHPHAYFEKGIFGGSF